MPEQLSNSNQTRAVSLALAVATFVVFAASSAHTTFAQNASKSRTAPAQGSVAKPADAKTATAREQKPAAAREQKPAPRPASEITRARRTTVAPKASPAPSANAAPASSATPAAKPNKASAVPSAASSAAPSAVPTAVPASASTVPAPLADVTVASASKSDAGKSADAEGELERLRAEIKDAKAGAERARLQRALVERLVALKREPEALDALRLMIHEDRFDPPFFFNTGNALARLGDASAAEDAYRKAISQRRGNYSRALNNLGVILIRQGHWDEAEETLKAALVQENYTYAEASYNLGRLHLLRGEADLAMREWLRTLRLDAGHTEAAVALARTYAADGDPERALLVLDNFAARSTRTGAGIPREITDVRREIVSGTSAPSDAPAANSKTGGRDFNSTRASANSRPRELDRSTYELLRSARAAREKGNLEVALKDYRGVLARSPAGYFPPANLELGVALINLKRDEEAITALLPVAQKEAARYPVAHYHLGRLFERQGHLARAADHFARAAELYGDENPQVLIDLSRVREKAGDHTGALAAMNDYATASARQGTVPQWVSERQAKLKQKATPTPNASTRTRP
ncbi:MAG TPA: tetratricopeptide repeat protein [Pyrinomonadaceae bacterium]|nr:tetratricopeptide repeat protein [Pyrinomonadaceae bacterium]